MSNYRNDPEEIKTAVLNNLSTWSWDIYPEFKLEKEEVQVIYPMLVYQLSNVEEYRAPHIENLIRKINDEYDFESNLTLKVTQDEGDILIQAIKFDKM